MANDAAEKQKWLAGIDYFLKETEKIMYSSRPGSPTLSAQASKLSLTSDTLTTNKHTLFVLPSSAQRSSGLQLEFSTLGSSSYGILDRKNSSNSLKKHPDYLNESHQGYFDKLKD
jgi:hypothetical protein